MNRRALFFILVLTVGVCPAQPDPYRESLPGTGLEIDMVFIPEGTFAMGSPVGETGRRPQEASPKEVEVAAFWMASREITWELYQAFLERPAAAGYGTKKEGDGATSDARSGETVQLEADAVSGATVPYVDMSLGMGTGPGMPVGNVTRKAAAQFCKWLSAKTGHFYRLPAEAEWEYAARAGSTEPYFFGADSTAMGRFAWYAANSGGTYHKVGEKEPNPWGLYDIYGNVAEWVLDGFRPESDPDPDLGFVRPDSEYPGIVKGGHYGLGAGAARSAARLLSHPVWKARDPQFPRSKWWFTDAPFAGFRIVRPLDPPPPETYEQYWNVK